MDKKKTLTKEELDKLETFIQKINVNDSFKKTEYYIKNHHHYKKEHQKQRNFDIKENK